MPAQISKQTKRDRGRELAAVEAKLRGQYFASLQGMRLRVLLESPVDEGTSQPSRVTASLGRSIGTSCRYAPVEIDSTAAELGKFVNTIAGPPEDGRLTAAVRLDSVETLAAIGQSPEPPVRTMTAPR
jgi:hypothetical protein